MARRKLARKEAENRIMEALTDAASEIGLGKPEEVKKQFQKLCANPSRYKKEIALPTVIAYQFYEIFGQKLKQGVTEENLEQIIKGLREATPQMPTILRKGMNEMKKKLRRRGGPGRGSLLDISQQREAIAQVALMHGQGKTLPQAFEETARIFEASGKKLSARTIKRVWEKRKVLHRQEV